MSDLDVVFFHHVTLSELADRIAGLTGGKASPRQWDEGDTAFLVHTKDAELLVHWFEGYDAVGAPLSRATAYVSVADASWFERLKSLDVPMLLIEETEIVRARHRMGDAAAA